MLVKIASVLTILSVLFLFGVGVFALVAYLKKGKKKKNYN